MGGYRTIGKVARLRVGHHDVSQEDDQKIDEKHVNVNNTNASFARSSC